MTPSLSPTALTPAKQDEAMELYALGVPVVIISRQFGISVFALQSRASRQKVRRPSRGLVEHLKRQAARQERHERIKRNIEAYPNRSMFDWGAA